MDKIFHFIIIISILNYFHCRSVALFVSRSFNDPNIPLSADKNIISDANNSKKFKIPFLLSLNINNEPYREEKPPKQQARDYLERVSSEIGDEHSQSLGSDQLDEPDSVHFDRTGYVGCYNDNDSPSRDLSYRITAEKIYPLKCRIECGKMNLKYSALQYGYLCFCGQKYGQYGEAAEVLCQTPCSGDRYLACGGVWKNLIYNSIIKKNEEHETNFTSWYLSYVKVSNNYSLPIELSHSTIPVTISPLTKSAPLMLATTTPPPIPATKTPPPMPTTKIPTPIPTIKTSPPIPATLIIAPAINPKSNIFTTPLIEDIDIQIDPVNIAGTISYICFMSLKQPWTDDLTNSDSSAYKIMHGNFLTAILNESHYMSPIYGVDFIRFVPCYTKISGNTNRIRRVGVFFRTTAFEMEISKGHDPLAILRNRLVKNQEFGGMPIYEGTFKSEVQKSRDMVLNISDYSERPKRDNDIKTKKSLKEMLQYLKFGYKKN